MVTTSDAADLVGVRYETLRNWLKKGLLVDRRSGSGGRQHKWRDYAATDIVCLQITRDALEAGVPLAIMVDICNDAEMLDLVDTDRLPSGRLGGGPQVYILVWSQTNAERFMIVAEPSVLSEIKRHPAPVTVLNLSHTIRQVISRTL